MRVQVLTENNNVMNQYHHQGKTYIEGRFGSNFKIKLTNDSYYDELAVITIDGLSVLDGKPGDVKGKGYIVHGKSTITIDGWRISDNEVRKFLFENTKQSYAAKTGNDQRNIGVIGVAVFKKKIKVPEIYYTSTFDYQPMAMYSATRSIGASLSSGALSHNAMPKGLGTGMGAKKESRVRTVDFEREDSPYQVTAIEYLTYEQLKQKGIIVEKQYNTPNPFPNSYCREV